MKNQNLPAWLLITTAQDRENVLRQIQIAVDHGAPSIQLRIKNRPKSEWQEWALEAQHICAGKTSLIINDQVEVALNIKADGVHLGKNDLHPVRARNVLGPKKIIGVTINSIEDAHKIARLPSGTVDYAGVGPWRFTTTKENLSEILQANDFKKIQEVLPNIPCYAIGGIGPDDLGAVHLLGLQGIALASYVFGAENPGDKIKLLNQQTSALQT